MKFPKIKFCFKKIYSDNHGFSLIELLLCIAILALIAAPLLNNFVTAAKVSAKADHIQKETMLVQSILEEMKSKPLAEIAREYDYPEDFGITEIQRELLWDNVKNRYVEVTADSEKSSRKTLVADSSGGTISNYTLQERTDTPYYFVRRNIEYDGKFYDVLITVDSISGNKTEINAVKMPVISKVNQDKNALIIESFETDNAVASLYSNHIAYCAEQEALHKEDPNFSIPYHTGEEIRKCLKRSMVIQITENSGFINITANFEYTCSDTPTVIEGCGSVSYSVEDTSIASPMGDIYVFYYPVSNDEISIIKDPSVTLEADVYVVRQNPKVALTSEKLVIGEIPEGIILYNNTNYYDLSDSEKIKNFIKEEDKNRIYDIKVQLYEARDNYEFNAEDLCVEFDSKEE